MSKTLYAAAYTADFIEINASIQLLSAVMEMQFHSNQTMQNARICVPENAAGATC